MTTRNDSQSINNQVINQQQQAIRELEHPFLKVPFECLNKTFRSSQKSVEKDLAVLEKAVKAMNKKAQKEKITEEDACKYLDKVVNKLIGVKRKVLPYLSHTSYKSLVEHYLHILYCMK
jgi:macrophage erythroblast attacher